MTGFDAASTADLGRSGVIYSSTGFDALELLSPRAPHGAERFRQLRQQSRDAHALIPPSQDRLDANSERGDKERWLQRLQAPRSQGGYNLPETDKQVVLARQELAKLADEAKRINELDRERSETWRSTSQPLWAVEDFVKNGIPGGTVLEDFSGPEPKLLKGENGLLDAIENRRRRVRELRADLHRVRSAPFPSSHAKAKMRAQIEALALQGEPNVSDLIEHDRPVTWPTEMLRSDVRGGDHLALGFAEVHPVLPVIAWMHKDALIKQLDRAIDDEADDAASLSHTEREKRESELEQDQLSVEREESFFVWRAIEERLPAAHRADCSPLAILQCKLTTAPAGAGRGTSLQHVIDIIGGR